MCEECVCEMCVCVSNVCVFVRRLFVRKQSSHTTILLLGGVPYVVFTLF